MASNESVLLSDSPEPSADFAIVEIFKKTAEGRKRLEEADQRIERVDKRRKVEKEFKEKEKTSPEEPMSEEAKEFLNKWAAPEEPDTKKGRKQQQQ